MARNTEQHRLRLFDTYSKNLTLYHPSVSGRFLCPICWSLFARRTVFTPSPEVTLAHVIPRRLGGRIETLTCRQCNNSLGTRHDSQLVREHEFQQWAHGDTSWPGRLRSESGEAAVSIRRKGRNWEFHHIKQQSDPRQSTAFFEGLSKSESVRFSATMRTWSLQRRNLALLHSAFLMMFRVFGYEYVLSPEASMLREVLVDARPVSELSKALIAIHPNAKLDALHLPSANLLTEPQNVRCFAVALPAPDAEDRARLVLMPGFGSDGQAAYERALGLEKPFDRFGAKTILLGSLDQLADPKFKRWAHWLWNNL